MKIKQASYLLCILLLSFILTFFLDVNTAAAQQRLTKDEISRMRKAGKKLPKVTAYEDRKYNIHDGGQIRTYFDNWGEIGYYHPTLEWPAYSGHEYCWVLAPIIGAEIVTEDTIRHIMNDAVFDGGDDEFNPVPYDSTSELWLLNPDQDFVAMSDNPDTWHPSWTGWPGEDGIGTSKATQESFWIMVDDNNFEYPDRNEAPPNGLGIELTCRGYQWGTIINEDLLFLLYTAKNISGQDLHKMVFGFYADLDCGYNDWLDDIAAYDNDRNMVYQWDEDNSTSQWEGDVDMVGLKFLESPVDPLTGEQLGLTSMRYFIYSQRPQGEDNDEEQWEYMRPGVFSETPTNGGVGSDCVFIFSCGYFDLPADSSVNLAVAIVFGVDENDLFANADLAQAIYDAEYRSAEAPRKPTLTAVPGDKKVTLFWDSDAEMSLDPLTNKMDFEGYKIYRSTDWGQTWGKEIINTQGYKIGYIPLVQFDLVNNISGLDPYGEHFYLGDDTGIVHTWEDNTVLNGMKYWYAVCAYDAGDQEFNIPMLENGRTLGSINVVEVTPQAPPIAMEFGSLRIDTLGVALYGRHNISTAQISPIILDQTALVPHTYLLTVDDTTFTGKVYNVYDETADVYVIENSSNLDNEDANPIFNGILLLVSDDELVAFDGSRSGWFSDLDGSSECSWRIDASASYVVPFDYEIRFTERGDTAKFPPTMITPFEIWNVSTENRLDFYSFSPPATDTTQEMKNTWTSGDPLTVREEVEGTMNFTWVFSLSADSTMDIDTVGITADEISYDTSYIHIPPELGDVAKIFVTKPLTSNDAYRLTASLPKTAANPRELDLIKVVPNPYIATAAWEPRSDAIGRGPRKIYFTHLPQKCTIRIYTIYGNLIRTIEHESSAIDGSEPWDLRSENDMDVAFGVYIYHIECEFGEKMGKLALIK